MEEFILSNSSFLFFSVDSSELNFFFFWGVEHKDWKYNFEMKKKKYWGGLPGGPINVLTVYPEHKAVTAAACHSQIPSWGSFTSESLLLSFSCFLISSNLPLHLHTIFFSSSSNQHIPDTSLSLPLPLSSSIKTQLQGKTAAASLFVCVNIQTSFCALEFPKSWKHLTHAVISYQWKRSLSPF